MNKVMLDPSTVVKQRQDKRPWRWLKYATLCLLILLAILPIAGIVYQAVGTVIDTRRYPPPGRLVDVGGYKLHIYCVGEGNPTVILDHVGDGNVAQWALIQPAVAGLTRVCAYDRAGFGWSDAGPLPRDGRQNAYELHTLLNNAGVSGPYVLVGHSFGANLARLYAAQHPNDVVGLVLVDPGFLFDRPGVSANVNEHFKRDGQFFMRAGPYMTGIGLLRLGARSGALGYGDLPPEQGEAFVALSLTPKRSQTLREQNSSFASTSAQVLAAEQHLGALPLIVLSAEQPGNDHWRQVWIDVNARIAALAPGGIHQVVPGSNHMSLALNYEHAQVTTLAILDMVAAIRAD